LVREVVGVSQEVNTARAEFFRTIFHAHKGYLCLAAKRDGVSGFDDQSFFLYPDELDKVLEWINRWYYGRNIYFCTQLLKAKQRVKENCVICPIVWSDLDDAVPDKLVIKPNVVVESSPNRYQGIWLLNDLAVPEEAEDASHRIAYYHAGEGADKNGWMLTKLLRVPLTYNMKYEAQPVVHWHINGGEPYPISKFREIPLVPGFEYLEEDLPASVATLQPEKVIEANRARFTNETHFLIDHEPAGTWSETLWKLECQLLESGLTKEETFVVARASAPNKYKRDGRGDMALWREICKAAAIIDSRQPITGDIEPIKDIKVLRPGEAQRIDKGNFVDRFIAWGTGRTDASPNYFRAGALMNLSAVLSGRVRLATDVGGIKLNLWFMLMGATTLDRKTTAMDMAIYDVLREVDEDVVLATEASPEGLLTALETRPGRPGIFMVDEFSGLLSTMTSQTYMTGMMEALTRAYDGKYYKKQLTKRTVILTDPIFLFFAGGIRERILDNLTRESVTSGFVPRFIFVESERDPTRDYRPLGPMTSRHDETREQLIAELQRIKDMYDRPRFMTIKDPQGNPHQIEDKDPWPARLTQDAWKRYNDFEFEMVQSGLQSAHPDMYSAIMGRLSVSTLKVATLLAAARQDPFDHNGVMVEEHDVTTAIFYSKKWREFVIDVVADIGDNVSERKIVSVMQAITRGGSEGVLRSTLMRTYKLKARIDDVVIQTLKERGQIGELRNGASYRYYDIRLRRPK
jgi:hypothetical protein